MVKSVFSFKVGYFDFIYNGSKVSFIYGTIITVWNTSLLPKYVYISY